MSITWYRGTDRFESGASGYMGITAPNNGGLIVQPTLYNDILYGTKENPAYRVYASRAIAGGTTWRYYPTPNGYIDGNTLIRIVGVIDGTPLNVTNYETDDTLVNTKISGKWRVKDNLVYVDGNTAQFMIPVINTVTLKNGSRYANSVIGNSYRSGPYGGGCSMAFGNISIGYMDEVQYEIADNYKDMVVDFGEIGQDVPRFVLDYMETNFFRIYPNTYTIKSATGQTVSQVNEQPPIKKTNLLWAGSSFQLTITGINDVIQTLTWEDTVPQGYTFVGLSTSPNGVLVIPLGESDISIESSATFYPVFRPYKVPPTLFQIELYKNTAEANRVDKTNYLTLIRSIGGVMREASSVTDMTITLQLNEYPNFNYVKIPILKRYYFVNDITLINANLYELDLSVDPLMSYKTAILGLTAFVDRNENLSNPRIIDKKRVVEQGVDIEESEIRNGFFLQPIDVENDIRFVITGYKITAGYTPDTSPLA